MEQGGIAGTTEEPHLLQSVLILFVPLLSLSPAPIFQLGKYASLLTSNS